MANAIQPGAEFQSLPLEMIVSQPLIAAVKAQAIAAETTVNFIKSLMDKDGKPQTVDFNVTTTQGVNVTTMNIQVPTLSIVPVPHLRIDSVVTHFKYQISQVVIDKSATSVGVELSASANFGPFGSATLKGNVSHSSSQESTTNRSGELEITVTASESPIPEGLAKILNLLAKSIPEPKTAATAV